MTEINTAEIEAMILPKDKIKVFIVSDGVFVIFILSIITVFDYAQKQGWRLEYRTTVPQSNDGCLKDRRRIKVYILPNLSHSQTLMLFEGKELWI